MGVLTDIEGRISPTRLLGTRLGSLVVAMVVRRRLQALTESADRALTDPRVRRELRRAAGHASRATSRARRIGPQHAMGDRCVAREVHRTRRHLTRAAGLAAHPRRSHRVRNAALVSAAVASAGAVYAARRATAPQPELVIEETDIVVTEVVI